MPQETLLVVIAILVPFIIFAVVLAWSDYRSRNTSRQQ